MEENTRSNDDELRAAALAMREAGRSNPEIQKELGISSWKLIRLFHGHVEPVHPKLAHRAKPELRQRARDLREQGWSYNAIARKLRVSKSSLSLWLRDLPKPEVHHPGEAPAGWDTQEWADFCMRRQEIYRERKAEERRSEVVGAAREIGELTGRELLLVGAMIYWCEGAKTKPWRRQGSVVLINSDPHLIRLFIQFLELVGCPREQLSFRLSIHENADVAEATQFWLAVVETPAEQFRKPVLKKHNPRTVRRKTGDHYHGALVIYVRRSAKLYRQIEGWARAVMLGSAAAVADIESVEEPPW